MLKYELNKLFIKQKALFLLIVVIIIDAFTAAYIYHKNTFKTASDERQFYAYCEEFSGKLTDEKNDGILAEQLTIIEAQNDEATVAAKLRGGNYESREEYREELSATQEVTSRNEPFNELFTRYSHALVDPEKRYILSGNYDGLSNDFCDLPFILLIVFSAAMLFLGEENSNMTTFLRIYENGRQKTFGAKMASLSLLIFCGTAFRAAFEFIMLNICGSFEELSYPIQSINYFDGCAFDLTIFEGFLAINLIKMLGYFFICALTILLAILIKKALLTVFIPFALCVLQQFSFDPPTPAYYMPTGLLRASGYFRGEYKSDINPDYIIEPVPPKVFYIVIFASAAFIAAVIFIAYKYYCPHKARSKKPIAAALCALFICGFLSGCSKKQDTVGIINYRQCNSFAQSSDYVFLSSDEGIYAIRKSDGEKIGLINDPFSDEIGYYNIIYACGNTLYYLEDIWDTEIKSINADTFEKKTIYSPTENEGNIIGLKYSFSRETISGDALFSNGENWFFNNNEGVFKMKNGKFENVLEDDIYSMYMSFDGRRIFYITQSLVLMCYDTKTGDKTEVCDDFVRAVYTDGERVVYTTEQGIFSFDVENDSTEKLTDDTAEQLACAGGKVVYLKEGNLYYIGDTTTMIYSGLQYGFAVIPETDQVWVRAVDTETNDESELFLDISGL